MHHIQNHSLCVWLDVAKLFLPFSTTLSLISLSPAVSCFLFSLATCCSVLMQMTGGEIHNLTKKKMPREDIRGSFSIFIFHIRTFLLSLFGLVFFLLVSLSKMINIYQRNSTINTDDSEWREREREKKPWLKLSNIASTKQIENPFCHLKRINNENNLGFKTLIWLSSHGTA